MSYKNGSYIPMHDRTLAPGAVGGLRLRSLQDGTEFSLDDDEILVGREIECSITLESGHISRYHAKISRVNGDIVVEDLRSTNGTFINGRRLSAPQSLSVGDEIRFHEIAFRLVTDEAGSGDAEATMFQAAPIQPAKQTAAPAPAGEPMGGYWVYADRAFWGSFDLFSLGFSLFEPSGTFLTPLIVTYC